MKRLLMTTIASLMIAGSFSLPAVAQQGRGGHSSQQADRGDRGDRGGDRGSRGDHGARPGQPNGATQLQGQPGQNRGARPGQPQTQSFQGQQAQNQFRGGDHNRDGDRNRNFADNRGGDRRYDNHYDNRDNHRYDNRNNYRYDNRGWNNNVRWDRHDWRRGDRLGDWNTRYYDVDYRDYRDDRLYAPPYGYRWVRDDNGDFLLAALAGGLIAAIIANN